VLPERGGPRGPGRNAGRGAAYPGPGLLSWGARTARAPCNPGRGAPLGLPRFAPGRAGSRYVPCAV